MLLHVRADVDADYEDVWECLCCGFREASSDGSENSAWADSPGEADTVASRTHPGYVRYVRCNTPEGDVAAVMIT